MRIGLPFTCSAAAPRPVSSSGRRGNARPGGARSRSQRRPRNYQYGLVLEVAGGNDAATEARHLLGREGWVGELLVQLERPEQVDDVVHALVEFRPVAGAAVVGLGRDGLEARQELSQRRVGRVR